MGIPRWLRIRFRILINAFRGYGPPPGEGYPPQGGYPPPQGGGYYPPQQPVRSHFSAERSMTASNSSQMQYAPPAEEKKDDKGCLYGW